MSDDSSAGKKPLFPQLYGEGRYLFLLISLLLLFFFYPFFDGFRIAPRLLGAFFLAILFSAVTAISAGRKSVTAAAGLAFAAFGSYVLAQFVDNLFLRAMTTFSFGLFFALITVVILRHILRVQEVTFDTILGAICAYLVLGMVWTMAYSLIELFTPGSFLHGGESVALGFSGSEGPVVSNFIYYSFVTLTTLGYGDITPNSSPAAALSSLEAVTGQLYLAILIARFVGMYIASSVNRGRE
jgi:hypothetical protein